MRLGLALVLTILLIFAVIAGVHAYVWLLTHIPLGMIGAFMIVVMIILAISFFYSLLGSV